MTLDLSWLQGDAQVTKSEKSIPDQIVALAFHLYLKEGAPEGKEREIWLRAKRILKEQAIPALPAETPRTFRPQRTRVTRSTFTR